MATRIIKPSYPYYRNLRNVNLIVVISLLVFLIGLTIYAYWFNPALTWLQSIVFLYACAYALVLVTIRQRLFTTNMLMHYYRMLEEDLPLVKGKHSPYDANFGARLKSLGFTLGMETLVYRIYYQVHHHTPYIKRTSPVIIWLVIYHQHEKDAAFFLERSEQDFQFIKASIDASYKIQNEITFWFQHIDEWQQQQKNKFQQIINFSISNRAIISIPCAVLSNQQRFYYLRPIKQYPNKYYYAAIKYIEALIGVEN